jgi:hypothetical protein
MILYCMKQFQGKLLEVAEATDSKSGKGEEDLTAMVAVRMILNEARITMAVFNLKTCLYRVVTVSFQTCHRGGARALSMYERRLDNQPVVVVGFTVCSTIIAIYEFRTSSLNFLQFLFRKLAADQRARGVKCQ